MITAEAAGSSGADPARQHTLVVTTFDRPAYLSRLLSIAASSPAVGSLVIADASHDIYRSVNRALADQIVPNHRVLHVDLPSSCSVIELYETAIRSVDTPYLTFCADDDLVHPSYLADAVHFLSEHPDHSACAGRSFSFGAADDQGLRIFTSGTRAHEADDAGDRFVDLLSSYWPVEFSTRRTEDAKSALSTLDAFRLCEAVGEPLHGAAHVLDGKVAILERPGVLRGWHDHNNANRSLDRRRLFFDSGFSPAFELVVDALRARTPTETDAALRLRIAEALVRHFACHPRYFLDQVSGDGLRQRAPGVTRAELERALRDIAEALHVAILGDHYEPSTMSPSIRVGFDEDEVSEAVLQVTPDGCVYTLCTQATRRSTSRPSDPARERVERQAKVWSRALAAPGFDTRYRLFRASHLHLLPDQVSAESAECCFDLLALRVLGEDVFGLQGFEVDDPVDVIERTGVANPASQSWGELVELASVALAFPHPRRLPGLDMPEEYDAGHP